MENLDLIQQSRSKLYKYQNEVLNECLHLQNGALNLQMGAGKCHKKDTEILMYDGTIKLVQNVKIGDLLMGDDSTPRQVLSLANGYDKMYEIKQSHSESYTVNKDHVMCLKVINSKSIKYTNNSVIVNWLDINLNEYSAVFYEDDYESFYNNLMTINDIEISVTEYLKLPNSVKSKLRGFHTAIDFNNCTNNNILDPKEYAKSYAELILVNADVKFDNKYKFISKTDRFDIVSILLNKIGFSDKNRKYIKLNHSFNKEVTNDILFICRSIGLSCIKRNNIFIRNKYKIYISGNMLHRLNLQIKHTLINLNEFGLSKINVKYVGIDGYFGFTLDCNNRYVLGDFTVTHNTVTSLVLALEQTKINNMPIIVVVSKTLISNWISEISKFFGDTLNYAVLHKDFIKNINTFELNDIKLIITTPSTTRKYYKQELIENEFVHMNNAMVLHQGNLVPRRVKEYLIPTNPYNGTNNVIYNTQWGCLIVDEIQEHCNINTDICCSIASICANHRWGLSGTLFNEPKIERIMGYFIMINNLDFPRRIDFAESYIKSDQFLGYMPTVVYRENINNFIKPKINKIIVKHTLTNNEINIYVSLKECLKIVNRHLKMLIGQRDTRRAQFSSYLLALITYLRQMIICPLLPITNCMVDNIDLNNDSSLSNIIINEFKKFKLDGYLNDANSIYSSRIKKINKIIHSIPDKKIIIFTCFKTNLDIMMHCIDDRDKYTIQSTMNITARGAEIEKFKLSENGLLFLTYQLGSEGLNLQFCDTLIFADMYWNMGKINQAEARIIRPGQLSKQVDIYYLISNTAIEKGILEKQNDKLVIIDEIKNGKMKSQIRTLNTQDVIKILDDEDNTQIYNSNLHFK